MIVLEACVFSWYVVGRNYAGTTLVWLPSVSAQSGISLQMFENGVTAPCRSFSFPSKLNVLFANPFRVLCSVAKKQTPAYFSLNAVDRQRCDRTGDATHLL